MNQFDKRSNGMSDSYRDAIIEGIRLAQEEIRVELLENPNPKMEEYFSHLNLTIKAYIDYTEKEEG
jgi:hypothetical protein